MRVTPSTTNNSDGSTGCPALTNETPSPALYTEKEMREVLGDHICDMPKPGSDEVEHELSKNFEDDDVVLIAGYKTLNEIVDLGSRIREDYDTEGRELSQPSLNAELLSNVSYIAKRKDVSKNALISGMMTHGAGLVGKMLTSTQLPLHRDIVNDLDNLFGERWNPTTVTNGIVDDKISLMYDINRNPVKKKQTRVYLNEKYAMAIYGTASKIGLPPAEMIDMCLLFSMLNSDADFYIHNSMDYMARLHAAAEKRAAAKSNEYKSMFLNPDIQGLKNTALSNIFRWKTLDDTTKKEEVFKEIRAFEYLHKRMKKLDKARAEELADMISSLENATDQYEIRRKPLDCPKCGSDATKRNGKHSNKGGVYQKWHCRNCNHNFLSE